jgi:surface antigen
VKFRGLVAAIALSSAALALSASATTAPVSADVTPTPAPSPGVTANWAASRTTDRNPFGPNYEGYCTWGAQELIHEHTGYYIRALSGNAEDWADEATAAGWSVVSEAQPHSVAVFSSSLVGGVGHVAWVDAVNGRQLTITDMNVGTGASAANGYRSTGFHQFVTHTIAQVPGMRYIVIPH